MRRLVCEEWKEVLPVNGIEFDVYEIHEEDLVTLHGAFAEFVVVDRDVDDYTVDLLCLDGSVRRVGAFSIASIRRPENPEREARIRLEESLRRVYRMESGAGRE